MNKKNYVKAEITLIQLSEDICDAIGTGSGDADAKQSVSIFSDINFDEDEITGDLDK